MRRYLLLAAMIAAIWIVGMILIGLRDGVH